MSINVNNNDMENVKGILIEFMEYYNDGNVFSIEEADIDGFIMQSKYRPREPRAVNRNEQAKEVNITLDSESKFNGTLDSVFRIVKDCEL